MGERTAARPGCRSGQDGRALVIRVGKLERRVPQDASDRAVARGAGRLIVLHG